MRFFLLNKHKACHSPGKIEVNKINKVYQLNGDFCRLKNTYSPCDVLLCKIKCINKKIPTVVIMHLFKY